MINNTTKKLINALADGRAVSLTDIAFDTGLSVQVVWKQFKIHTSLFIQTKEKTGNTSSMYKISEEAKAMITTMNKHEVNDNLKLFHSLPLC